MRSRRSPDSAFGIVVAPTGESMPIDSLNQTAKRIPRFKSSGTRSSLWEFRGRARVHTFSSAMCWAACDRLAKIAGILGLSERVSHWRAEANRIRATILDKGWDAEQNTFVESLGGKDVDASLLLLQEIGFVAASDPRFLGTIAAVEKRLRNGCHIFRYTAPDDFGAPTVA